MKLQAKGFNKYSPSNELNFAILKRKTRTQTGSVGVVVTHVFGSKLGQVKKYLCFG